MTLPGNLQIIDPGLLSIVVDGGRYGFQRQGLTVGGPADSMAFRWANYLLNNPVNAIGIEIIGSGFCFTVTESCQIAFTGAVTNISVNSANYNSWRSVNLSAGDRVQIEKVAAGLRSYLAIRSGFNIAPTFGSATTIMREGIGGLNGQGLALRKDDIIQFEYKQQKQPCVSVPDEVIPSYPQQLKLKVVTGYQYADFDVVAKHTLFHSSFMLRAQSDRMAARFDGPKIRHKNATLRSEGICRGAIQIPTEGEPIVMLNDRQTIGGYPKMGSVVGADCDRLAQATAGAKIEFEQISLYEAHNYRHLLHYKEQFWRKGLVEIKESLCEDLH